MKELRKALGELEEKGLRRTLREAQSAPGARVQLDGRWLVNLGSNNYLGLTEHPEVRDAAREAIDRWGTGSSGSRLTSGSLSIHRELEKRLAQLKETEDAVLFSSGYLAAIGTIPSLVGEGDLVLSDRLNHASLVDGCRLSRAEIRVYRHSEVEHARELLQDRDRYRRVLVVTDGVFSMDGDLAPLPELCELCEATDAWLMVDDAHGVGVLGARGAGSVEHFGVSSRVQVQMGTLSKALASEGGFVAGSGDLVEWIRNRARSFYFSTATAPASAGAAIAAIRILDAEPERRRMVIEKAKWLRTALKDEGVQAPCGITPIIPVMVGDPHAAVKLSTKLEEMGVRAPAIRPTTVPEGTARLRLSVMATHTQEDLDLALAALRSAAESHRTDG